MHQVSFFTRAPLRRLLVRATSGVVLCAAAVAAHAAATLSGAPASSVTAGSTYSFQPGSKDSAGLAIAYFGINNKPAWATFNTKTGLLTGKPTSAQVGTYSKINIYGSDGREWASTPTFSITVASAGSIGTSPAVKLSASPGSVSSGAASTLSWSASNATSCTASGGWSGSMAMSGSKGTGALTATKTYTLTCNGASGTKAASASTTVTVQSSTAGKVTRPSYNTGYGLFVLNGKLYDSNGIEFKIRGVNLCHYDSTDNSGAGISRSNANAVRMALWVSSVPTTTYASTLQTYISDGKVVIPTMFEVPGTQNFISGDQSTADLASAVSNWVTNVSHYASMQQHLIIDIANEWGPSNSATWASAYESAIARLRAAGYTAPIMVDTGGSGEDSGDLLNYATEVFNSDPQKNVIFSLHVYYNAASVLSGNVLPQLAALAASKGMVFVVGEFGPGRDIGPAPTMVTPQQIIQAADAAGLGWMGWAWDDNNLSGGKSDNNGFSMTYAGPGIYNVASDLTTYGQQVVLSSYGLVLAKKATDF